MPKPPPPPFQGEAGQGKLPRTLRETYAETLKLALRELHHAETGVRLDDSNENRARYAAALAAYDRLQGQFPFVAAGAGDAEA